MVPWRGSLGSSFVSEGCQLRVLWKSGMYVRTITMYGYMYRRSHYIGVSERENNSKWGAPYLAQPKPKTN